MSEQGLLTVREVAHRVGRSEETVRRWIWSGKLSAQKIGNQHFVSLADVDAVVGLKLAETKAAYGIAERMDTTGYDPEIAVKQAMRAAARGRELAKQYGGPFDVVAALREHRDSRW